MYDVIIIGCGPAGMTAAIYLKRANKKVLILEKETIGGQMASSPLIENYPGYNSISGSTLANNMFEQVTNLGIDIELEEVIKIEAGKIKKVVTEDNTYEAKAIIIAVGTKNRLLGLPNEENLIGKGIHFCVSCDGAFYKDRIVAVVGGGNSALVNALSLANLCKKVYILQNLSYLTGEKTLIEKSKKTENIEILLNTTIEKINGDEELKSIEIICDNDKKIINLNAMFISIGLIPQTDVIKNLIDLDNYGYVNSTDCKTNVEGIFVAGDLRKKKYRQITTATSDGTISANLAIEYLDNLK